MHLSPRNIPNSTPENPSASRNQHFSDHAASLTSLYAARTIVQGGQWCPWNFISRQTSPTQEGGTCSAEGIHQTLLPWRPSLFSFLAYSVVARLVANNVCGAALTKQDCLKILLESWSKRCGRSQAFRGLGLTQVLLYNTFGVVFFKKAFWTK